MRGIKTCRNVGRGRGRAPCLRAAVGAVDRRVRLKSELQEFENWDCRDQVECQDRGDPDLRTVAVIECQDRRDPDLRAVAVIECQDRGDRDLPVARRGRR